MESGGFEHHHDTPPYPFMPSPTFAHNSIARSRWAGKTLGVMHVVVIPLLVAAMTLYVYRAGLG
jgi:hypothetical protein